MVYIQKKNIYFISSLSVEVNIATCKQKCQKLSLTICIGNMRDNFNILKYYIIDS